ncbi:MAG: rhomboid family intramembrane serine protease [Candidatus Sericytochromatia bacterium]
MNTNDLDNFEPIEEVEDELKGFQYFKAWIISFPITALCIFVPIILFLLVSYSTYFENTSYPEYVRNYLAIVKYGGVLGGPAQELLWAGEVWRIFVNLFHHGGILHIFFNLYALYYFGSFTEKYLGSFKLLLFIFFCGLCQEIVCQLTIEQGAIGLSGIIFGLFGFLYIVSKFDEEIALIITPSLSKAMFIQLFLFIPLTYFELINIANVGHFSGLIYGILFALAFYYNPNIIKKISFLLLNVLIISGLYYVYKPINNAEYDKWISTKKVMAS